MVIYFIISLIAFMASVLLLFEYISISAASAVPAVLIAISILQAVIFKSYEHENKQDFTSSTMFSPRETDDDKTRSSMKIHCRTKLAIIPILCPFIIYFDTVWKIIIPIVIYILSYFPVRLLVKLYERKK